MPTTPFYQVLHRIADRLEPELFARFERAIADLVAAVDLGAVEEALAVGAIEQAVEAAMVGIDSALEVRVFEEALQRAFIAAAQASSEQLSDIAGVEAIFDLGRPLAVAWATEHAGELVTSFGVRSAEGLHQALVDGVAAGVHPRQLARGLDTFVGLSKPGAKAVSSFRELLQANDTAAAARRLSPRDRAAILREIKAGTLTDAKIERFVQRYASSMVDYRLDTIARTDSMKAASAGQHQMWRQGVQDGLLPVDVMRVWIVTPDDRLCPICESLAGQPVPMEVEFVSPYNGMSALYSPIHPDCRCVVGILLPDMMKNFDASVYRLPFKLSRRRHRHLLAA